MATSLLKFSFKTGLIKSVISEIASNISKYYYTFGKANPWFSISGVTATVVANSNTVILTSGTTTGFKPGQLVTQTSGIGRLSANAKVESIVSSTQFIVTEAHVTSGAVTFSIDDETVVEQAIDSYEYEIGVRNNAVLYKQIDANDVAPVITRINWTSGFVFDMYREYTTDSPSFNGATSIDTAQFYVLTDQYRVYKCLDNNNDSPSSVKPTTTSNIPFTLADGYKWKYMYTIPITLRNKFLSTTLMPVANALTTQFYSSGAIVGYSIESQGLGYNKTSYKIDGFKIINGGTGYTAPSITITAPDQPGGTTATVLSVTVVSGVITAITMNQNGDGYSYSPTFTIVGGNSSQAIIEPIVVQTSTSYTKLTVDGDGYLEENPYEVESIEILNGGTGYGSIDLAFTNPDLPNGVKAVATVTIVAGVATAVAINNSGYGYSNQFNSITEDPNASNVVTYGQTNLAGTLGSGFRFRVINKKNNAVIEPIINTDGQIEQIRVIKPGIGYTYASVKVENFNDGLKPPTEKASILLDFSVGSIESNQSTVEITAVPGAIDAVYVKSAGFGYVTTPTVEIVGNGTGATASAQLDAFGRIRKININNSGIGYTEATAVITGFATENAVLDVVLPPKDGHGSDAISELYAKTILFRTNLFKDTIYRQAISNSFRQVCLVKNPKAFNARTNLRLGIASSALLVIGSNSQVGFGEIAVNDILTKGNSRFLVISKYEDYDENNDAMLLGYLDSTLVSAGDTIGKQGANFSVNSVILPGVNKFSGEVLTIDNRVKFSPSADQIVIASNTITF